MKNFVSNIPTTTLPIYGSCWRWVFYLFMMGAHHLHAQEFGVEYTTELQTNFKEVNFVNLLRLNAEQRLGKSLSLETSTISIAKTREERIIEDLQTFSNIEEDNLPLAIAVCGANWQINDKHSLFMGIRNMNEDYFTSAATSFFTNSSCGVYPTISANYPIANYPLSSVGIHYHYTTNGIDTQISIYNGTGYNNNTGRNNIFRFCPKSDGVFILGEMKYHHKGSSLFLGNAMHSSEKNSTTPWLYVEQQIKKSVTLLACYSHAFGSITECHDFEGLGINYQHKKYELGLFTDYARFHKTTEWATEWNLKYTINGHIYLQPIVHTIMTDSKFKNVCCIRLGLLY